MATFGLTKNKFRAEVKSIRYKKSRPGKIVVELLDDPRKIQRLLCKAPKMFTVVLSDGSEMRFPAVSSLYGMNFIKREKIFSILLDLQLTGPRTLHLA